MATKKNELTPTNAMPLSTVADMKDFSEQIAKSGLLGACSPAKAFVITQHCAQANMSVLDFKMKYHVTDRGDIQMRSDRMLAEYQSRGGKCVWTDISPTRAAAKFTMGENKDLEVEYTLDEAKKAGLVRSKSAWESDPGAMCRARVITRGIRIVDPGAIAGIYEPSELPPEKNSTPPSEPVAVDVEVRYSKETDTPSTDHVPEDVVDAELVEDDPKPEKPAPKKGEGKPKAKPVPAKKPDPEPEDAEEVDDDPNPFKDEVGTNVDYSICPMPYKKQSGVPFDEFPVEHLEAVLKSKHPDMEPGHYEFVKKMLETKTGE